MKSNGKRTRDKERGIMITTKPIIGSTANIHIYHPQFWTKDCAETFEGKSGVVVAISRTDTSNGYKFGDRAYLVQFDEPQPRKGTTYTEPYKCFWFDALDLHITGQAEIEPEHFWCCHCVKCESKAVA